MIIHVVGNVGSGKSMILDEIVKSAITNNFITVNGETQFKQDGLGLMHSTFEECLCRMIGGGGEFKEALRSPAKYIFTESSPETNLLVCNAMAKTDRITQPQFDLLQALYDVQKQKKIEYIVYLKTTPEFCLRNVQKRATGLDRFWDLASLMDINDVFEKWEKNTGAEKLITVVNNEHETAATMTKKIMEHVRWETCAQ